MMKRKKIAIVLGTRPEAIKFVPIIYELKKRSNVEMHVINTGQHLEMLNLDLTLRLIYTIETTF